MLEFRILGPLEVLADGEPVTLRKKQRALLTLLLLRVGEVVSTDELIEELWAGSPPATARDALQNYVSQLRKALGSDVIVTRDPGYLFEATPEQTDLGRFEKLAGDARGRDAETRAAKLREALELWRGTPLSDLAYESFTGVEMARLEELRAAARADLVDAELELGRNAGLVPELEATIAERPFDERPRGQLMLALYRASRQADALEVYQQARSTLDEELGLEPSALLRELEQAILRQDPALQAPHPAQVVAEGRRKTVTILFADLVESTELAEALDPEILRRVLDGYFADARRAIEHHGGTVEKFIGDAVMAVFGVPVAHEDDALRAVRAAVELRAAVAALGEALEREQGLRLDLRIGVNTGEVYVADVGGAGLVTGNAVNLAKRLEQAAPSGSIMLGAGTLALVRDAVRVKAVRPRQETAPPAFRLLELLEGVPAIARYFEAPLIGRDEELTLLRQAYAAACEQRRPQLITVVGEPGVGKTRLARELVAILKDIATVLIGRCVAYGDGATFLPLRDMVEQVEGGLSEAVADDEQAALVVQRVAELVGLAEGNGSVEEGFWAMRRLFEALSRERPLVLVFEDVHWAEPKLLDLVEYLGERPSGPILSLSITRPELLDHRPSWRDATVWLSPLAEVHSAALVASLPGGAELPAELRSRIVAIAEGNPLFAEELLAYVEERGPSGIDDIPPSVEALLASRLDLLQPEARAVLERAAVVGREFSRDAISALSPPDPEVLSSYLLALVRSGLIRPTPVSPPEEQFRFHHVLVRDVAYAGMPKAQRADIHERYADWLEDQPDAWDEVMAYHLEQAVSLRTALGASDAQIAGLATRAGTQLVLVGQRAFSMGDFPASTRLLERAVAILPKNSRDRLELLPELGRSLESQGQRSRAHGAFTEAIDAARAAGDRRLELEAVILSAMGDLTQESSPHHPESHLDPIELAKTAIPVFEEHGDHSCLAKAWRLIANVHLSRGQTSAGMEAAEHQIGHAQRITRGFERPMLNDLAFAAFDGETPVPAALELCVALLEQTQGNRRTEAGILGACAMLEAVAGRFEKARSRIAEAMLISEELATIPPWIDSAFVELLADDPASAERELRDAQRTLESVGNAIWNSQAACLFAEATYRQDRLDEAQRVIHIAREGARFDIGIDVMWRGVQAKLLARRNEFDTGEQLAREAVALSEPTDLLCLRGNAFIDLAEVLRLAGDADKAATAAETALKLYERKGDVVSARKADAFLADLRMTARK